MWSLVINNEQTYREGGNFPYRLSSNFFSSPLLLRFLFPQLLLFSLRKGAEFPSSLLIPLLDTKFQKKIKRGGSLSYLFFSWSNLCHFSVYLKCLKESSSRNTPATPVLMGLMRSKPDSTLCLAVRHFLPQGQDDCSPPSAHLNQHQNNTNQPLLWLESVFPLSVFQLHQPLPPTPFHIKISQWWIPG